MGKIYVGQTHLTLIVDCKTDLTLADIAEIKYIKPDTTTGSWTATVTDATAGIIEYTMVSPSGIDQEGKWIIWSFITFLDNSVAPGEPAEMKVWEEGT